MNRKLELSCEVFPPKGEDFNEKTNKIINELNTLKPLGLDLVSVTYGAGGSNRDNTLKLVEVLHKENFNIMPHFTCVCSSKKYIEDYIEEIKRLGIKNILALRGDEPADIDVCYTDFKYAYELVDYLNKNTDFNIAVAGYPEKHPRAKTLKEDILNLKKKVDMGAKAIYTQLFFDNENFYRFEDACRKFDIYAPIIAGIMPVTNFKQLKKMTDMCHAIIPSRLYKNLEKYQNNANAIKEMGIEYASKQCYELINRGVEGLHFYTLNKAESTKRILENIL